MNILKKSVWNNNIAGFAVATIIIVLAAYIQFSIYIPVDMSLHIETAKRMLSGEKLYADIFEVNFPMTRYMVYPPVLLSEVTNIHVANLFILWVLSLGIISFISCLYVLKQTDKYNDEAIFRFLITITLSFSIFLLPFIPGMTSFGQKPHIMMILSMPYFLTHLLTKDQRLGQTRFLIFVGVLAGVGLCMKPYYFIIPFVLEIRRIILERNIFSWLRLENIIIALISIGFLSHILLYYPEYLEEVLPRALIGYRYHAEESHVIAILSNALYIVPPLIFMLPFSKKCKFGQLFFYGFVGAIINYMVQFGGWIYILMPAITFILLMVSVILSNAIKYFYFEIICVRGSKVLPRHIIPILGGGVYLLLIIPVLFYNGILSSYQDKNRDIAPYVEILDEYKNVFFIVKSLSTQFPAVTYSNHGNFNTYLQTMYLYTGVKIFREKNKDKPEKWVDSQIVDLENFIRKHVVDDFISNDPDAVVVLNKVVSQLKHGSPILVENKFDYIEFLSKDSRFKDKWKQYRYQRTVLPTNSDYKGVGNYKDVYKKKAIN